MGTKQRPESYDCYAQALNDEPMFVLLARDHTAPERVIEWAMKRARDIVEGRRPVSDLPKVSEAIDCARQMREWRVQNDGKWRCTCRVPRRTHDIVPHDSCCPCAPRGGR